MSTGVHIDEAALQAVNGQLADRNLEAMSVQNAFERVVEAVPTLFGADGAGILLADAAQVLRHACSTDRAGQVLESAQEASGRGPCVESLVDGVVVTVCDILADERWPELGPILASNGVRAVIGMPLRVGGVPIGSVNVYSRAPRAWDESDRSALAAIESLVERVVSSALLAHRQEELISQLERALEARVLVERAVGMLMAKEGLDAPGAFERLRRAARSSRRPVREVASEVIATRQVP
jgi:GAF domain-containing protein